MVFLNYFIYIKSMERPLTTEVGRMWNAAFVMPKHLSAEAKDFIKNEFG